ncbi:ABC transporter permease [uncultured Erythrobacter sp.]|uniref:ABC transporter permease n=1 Tax=uncultured Erythrobacter sp. TaxID=263913 RepID=UPI00261A628C|nr:ABC transporter permease [uncultured Erythrobacter sp.]
MNDAIHTDARASKSASISVALRRYSVGVVLPVLLVVSWEYAVRSGVFPPTLSAAPSEIVRTCYELLVEGELIRHTALSLLRITVGVTNGALFGVIIGIAAVVSKRLDAFISPTIGFLAPIPAIVWLPFAIMFFGTGEIYKVFLPAFVSFLLVFTQTYQAARSIPIEYIELANMYEKSRLSLAASILLPASFSASLIGVRIALAISWIAIFVVEYSSADQGMAGLGWFIADSREVGKIEDQFAGVLVLGILGFGSDAILAYWSKSRSVWSKTVGDAT